MGFLHHSTAPLTDVEIAGRAARLSDEQVADAATFALVYERLRGAFLALSGMSLLRTLALADAESVAGIVTIARSALSQARDHLSALPATSSTGLAVRIARAAAAVEILDAEAARVAREPRTSISMTALESARQVLSTISAPAVGIRHFSSVSCAGYHSHADAHGSGHHDHPAEDAHVHGPADASHRHVHHQHRHAGPDHPSHSHAAHSHFGHDH